MLSEGCPADSRCDSIARVNRAEPHTNAVAPGSAIAPITAASSREPPFWRERATSAPNSSSYSR